MRRLFTILCLLIALSALADEEMRTWTIYGASIRGAFVEDRGEKVAIKAFSGRTLEIKKTKLGEKDLAYIDSLTSGGQSGPEDQTTRSSSIIRPPRWKRLNAQQRLPVIDKTFFGIWLGAHVETLIAACATNNIEIYTNRHSFAAENHPGKKFSFDGAIEPPNTAKETIVSVFENQIYAIKVVLLGNHESDYYEFRNALERKYAKKPVPLKKLEQMKTEFTTTISGQNVIVILEYYKGYGVQELTLTYIYDALAKRVLRVLQANTNEDASRTRSSAKIYDKSATWKPPPHPVKPPDSILEAERRAAARRAAATRNTSYQDD